jgi:adenosylmethionine-8-amino-7-oxononanoate aminotransferase
LEKSLTSSDNVEHLFLDFMQMKEFAKDPLIMKSAKGVWYEDIHGKKYLDGLSGIYVVNCGHGNERVINAIKGQLDTLTFAPPLHSTNVNALALRNLIAGITPGDLHTVKLFTGGSEATEAAMKLARQYHKQTGNPTKYKVISRYESFHGVTMGALAASGLARRKTVFEPFPAGYIKVFPPTCYRCPYGLEYPQCAELCATIVEKVVKQEDPSTVSSLIVEPIGNTGGLITPPIEYFRILREICDKYNILLIFDEIITGFGRTGQMFGAQTFETIPDILCMGKGMSSGYAPIGGMAFKDSIAEAFLGSEEEKVAFNHGHTFGGNPLSSVAAIANINEIKDRDLPRRAREAEPIVWKRFEEISNATGIIGEIRGKGLMIGVEFVKDPKTKEPFPEGTNFGSRVGKAAIRRGLIIRADPQWIAVAPPLVIERDEIDTMMNIVSDSISEVKSSLGA